MPESFIEIHSRQCNYDLCATEEKYLCDEWLTSSLKLNFKMCFKKSVLVRQIFRQCSDKHGINVSLNSVCFINIQLLTFCFHVLKVKNFKKFKKPFTLFNNLCDKML